VLRSTAAVRRAFQHRALPSGTALARHISATPLAQKSEYGLDNFRNIGISAHIDSGKTTLTERILFYTGRIGAIHEVRGKDGVGAKMDSMDLEREKGITIQSAATYCTWDHGVKGAHHINIIDTPGHVDFTIEVERALRVLDGAILVLCSVSGVQSQSITVDRQMKRYKVPRLAFVNKCDRMGANPYKVKDDLRDTLKLNAHMVQLPIGLEDAHEGVVDLVTMQAFINQGPDGEKIEVQAIPEDMVEQAAEAREALVAALADVDEEIGEMFLMEEEPTNEQLSEGIRRATIALELVPVFCGSAFKNKGVQQLLDGVVDYLPRPTEVSNMALDLSEKEEAQVELECDPSGPLVALAFKLEEGKYGQLTYMRIYSGKIKKGEWMYNIQSGKKMKVPRLVRMHSADMEDVTEAGAGDVVAMFGVDCASMDSFTDGKSQLSMTSMFVPDAVMSLAIKEKTSAHSVNFSKALSRFAREDPTFRVSVDKESNETVIAGMGELHLEIYIERMKREYNVDIISGKPQVNYRETISNGVDFNYLHKKQSGGSGQYARVIGRVEPLTEEEIEDLPEGEKNLFVNALSGNNIPPEYVPACSKGAIDGMIKGPLVGHPVEGVKITISDGQAHTVDSSELAFRIAMQGAIRESFAQAFPQVLEPVMKVEVEAPPEFQGTVIGALNKRKGQILGQDTRDDSVTVISEVPLNNMFGYSTDLRSCTQGKGEFTMEYAQHAPVPMNVQKELIEAFQKKRAEERR
jgi:elongation factor G